MFFASQIIHIVQASFFVLLAYRANHYLGLSDLMLYLLIGSFAEVVERMLTIIPSFVIMAKTIPPGIEGTMISLTMTLINLNQFILRTTWGTFINDNFVGVTKNRLGKYYILTLIQLASKFFPLFLINCLLPTVQEVNDL